MKQIDRRAKLTEAQARQAKRYLYKGCTIKSIADYYRVGNSTIWAIKMGITWKWVSI